MPASSLSARAQARDHRVAPGAAGTLSGVATRTWPEPVERVTAYLREAGAEVRVEEFAEGTPTADAAARVIGCDLGQIVKSLVFDCGGRPVVVLVPGDRRADAPKIAQAAGSPFARIAGTEEVRIWSAGTSSGEEAYSIAILLCEALGEDRFIERVKIYATDVDDDALSMARGGYTMKELGSLDEQHVTFSQFGEVVGDTHPANSPADDDDPRRGGQIW